tara:strand:+ start:277 stop:444 length:168 start_codon:yes stop_codon:yes gene_type:complete
MGTTIDELENVTFNNLQPVLPDEKSEINSPSSPGHTALVSNKSLTNIACTAIVSN